MKLLEEFLHREKMGKALAVAAECKARADAGMARIEACAAEMIELLAAMKLHAAALGIVVDGAPTDRAKQ